MKMSGTKRALIAIAALVCLAAAAAGIYLYRLHGTLSGVSGKPPDLLSMLPPGAPIVVYIDVATLRKSQDLFGALGLGPDQPASPADRDYQEFVRGTGFDYTRDLDRAAIAIWPSGVVTPAGLGENQVMAVADGRFEEAKIKSYALRTGKAAMRGSQTFYEVPGDPPMSFAFQSPTRIVLTSGRSLNVLAPMPNGGPGDQAMQARIERVAGAPVFAAARTDTLPSNFYDNFKNAPEFARLARSIQGLTLAGQPQGDHMDVALDAECDSIKNALEISTLVDSLRMFGTMALSDPKTRRSMTKQEAALLAAVASQSKVSQQDRWVRLTLTITPAMLSQGTAGPHANVRHSARDQAGQMRGARPSNASSSNARIPSFASGRGL